MKKEKERRKHPRYQAKDGALAISFIGKKVGRLVDISLDGLSFRYVQAEAGANPAGATLARADRLDIVFGKDNFLMKGVPVNTVADHETGPLSPDNTCLMRRRCCMQFVELSTEQLFQLKHFILTNTQTDAHRPASLIGWQSGMPDAEAI